MRFHRKVHRGKRCGQLVSAHHHLLRGMQRAERDSLKLPAETAFQLYTPAESMPGSKGFAFKAACSSLMKERKPPASAWGLRSDSHIRLQRGDYSLGVFQLIRVYFQGCSCEVDFSFIKAFCVLESLFYFSKRSSRSQVLLVESELSAQGCTS